MVFKQSKLFDQLLWLLLIGLLHKCNNTKQICFTNKNCVRFKLIHYLVVYEFSVEPFERAR